MRRDASSARSSSSPTRTRASCCSPATSASWRSSRSPSASRTASSTSASPSRTWSASRPGSPRRASSRSSTRSRRSRRCARTSSSATARSAPAAGARSSASAAGSSTAHNGLTHYALEDVGVMRVQPGLTVVAPADHEQAQRGRSARQRSSPARLPAARQGRRAVGAGSRRPLRARATHEARRGRRRRARRDGRSGQRRRSRRPDARRARDRVPRVARRLERVSPAPADDLAEGSRDVPVAVSVEAHYVTGARLARRRGRRRARVGLQSGPVRCQRRAERTNRKPQRVARAAWAERRTYRRDGGSGDHIRSPARPRARLIGRDASYSLR